MRLGCLSRLLGATAICVYAADRSAGLPVMEYPG